MKVDNSVNLLQNTPDMSKMVAFYCPYVAVPVNKHECTKIPVKAEYMLKWMPLKAFQKEVLLYFNKIRSVFMLDSCWCSFSISVLKLDFN